MKPEVVRNLWYNPQSAYSKREFSYPGSVLLEHRCVRVFKNPFYSSWDYILGDAAISQRAGFNPVMGRKVIDGLLDGETPCSEEVAQHITASGFCGLTYAQYHADYLAGLRA